MTVASRGARLADRGLLRRIELLAAGWTAVGAGGCLAAGSPAGALVLTGASAVSIVAFRGLQRVVAAIGPRDETRDPTDQTDPTRTSRAGETGGRPGLGAVVRLGTLGALLIAGSFLLDPGHYPALVLGFSTLPAALMTEGLLQAVRALRGKDHDHDDVS